MAKGGKQFAIDLDALVESAFAPLRGPLGPALQASNELGRAASDIALLRADNLLLKARRSLRAGAGERADRFVGSAAALPFDTYEQVHPAYQCAHMALFNTVLDDLEASDVDDSTWLQRCLDVIDRLDAQGCAAGSEAMRGVLAVIVQDYTLGAAERRAILARLPEGFDGDALEVRAASGELARAEVVAATLRAINAFEDLAPAS